MIHLETIPFDALIACVTCSADRGGAVNAASSGAILFMLVVLVGVFGGVFQFMRYLSKCEKRLIDNAGRDK